MTYSDVKSLPDFFAFLAEIMTKGDNLRCEGGVMDEKISFTLYEGNKPSLVFDGEKITIL